MRLYLAKNFSVVSNIVDILKKDFDVESEEDINGGDVSKYLLYPASCPDQI